MDQRNLGAASVPFTIYSRQNKMLAECFSLNLLRYRRIRAILSFFVGAAYPDPNPSKSDPEPTWLFLSIIIYTNVVKNVKIVVYFYFSEILVNRQRKNVQRLWILYGFKNRVRFPFFGSGSATLLFVQRSERCKWYVRKY